jgi:hypothetical protein
MKNIKFIPFSKKAESIIDPPSLASRSVPEWFKKLNTHIVENKIPRFPKNNFGHITNLTVKSCTPFLDSLISGYTLKLESDVFFVDPKEYEHRVIWDVSWKVVDTHSSLQFSSNATPEGFDKNPWKWITSWGIKTDPGYSILITHPLNRYDLPFLSFSAIVDSDKFYSPLAIPFFIKKDFIGKIEKETPIAQFFPIKREKWVKKIEKFEEKYLHEQDKLKMKIEKSYKKNMWNKKEFF